MSGANRFDPMNKLVIKALLMKVSLTVRFVMNAFDMKAFVVKKLDV